MTTTSRWTTILALLAGLAVALVVLFQFGLRALKSQVEKALGPDSEIADIRVGWGAVEVSGLRLKGAKGWPAADTLRAKRILVTPELHSLIGGHVRIASIVVEDAYVSALRAADGRMQVVPSLLAGKHEQSAGASTKVSIGHIELRNAAMDFFDATVARPPYKISLEQVNAAVDNIELPDLTARSALAVEGLLKGRHHDGHISIKGWMQFANLDSSIASRFRDVDLVSLQPYLIKGADTGVRSGWLDLDLDSAVDQRRLHAPGVVTLKKLELSSGSSFMGFARQSALDAMKTSQDSLTIHFLLEGNLDDPGFSVNENLATRFATGLAQTLGVSVEGLAKGVGGLGEKSLEAAGGAAGGLGKALKNIFGK